MKKSVIFVADSLDNAHKFQQVLSALDVEVAAGSSLQFKNLLVKHPGYDLVIYEVRGDVAAGVAAAEDMLVADGNGTLLVILSEEQLADFVPPARVRSDFVMRNATAAECTVRVRQLLWPGSEQTTASCVTVDAMTINLATHQVEVDGEPLDLTLPGIRAAPRSSRRIPGAPTRATRCCAMCGGSTTTADRARSTSTSAASAPSSAPSSRSTSRRCAASATSGIRSKRRSKGRRFRFALY